MNAERRLEEHAAKHGCEPSLKQSEYDGRWLAGLTLGKRVFIGRLCATADEAVDSVIAHCADHEEFGGRWRTVGAEAV